MVMIRVDALSTYLEILHYSIPKLFLMGFFLFAVVFPLKLLNWSSLALKLPHCVMSGAK